MKKEISIKHVVNDRCIGTHIETDILQGTITISKGLWRRRLTLWEAERLEFLLRCQIDRIKGVYPKEEVEKDDCGIDATNRKQDVQPEKHIN